jgi:LPS-assembly protein
MGWRGQGFDLAGSYAWLAPSPVEGRPDSTNQWRVDGAVEVSARWRASADLAYDLRRERAAETEIGLEYRTECVTWDVELSRRFSSDLDDSPNTAVTVQVALAGFGAGEGPRPRRLGCAR